MAGIKGKSGRKKLPGRVLQDGLDKLQGDIPKLLERLKIQAYGKPIMCQFCGRETGENRIDRDSAIYLIDRILGKPKQVSEVDLLARTELTSTQALKMYNQIQGYAAQYSLENPGPLLDQVKLLSTSSDNGHSANPDTDSPHNEHTTQI